jgi:hypothetical protein
MKGKILLVIGLGVGYVLGTRAGREKYDQLTSAVKKLWDDPRVQKQRANAEDFVKEKVPGAADFFGATAAPKPATSKPAARKPAASK